MVSLPGSKSANYAVLWWQVYQSNYHFENLKLQGEISNFWGLLELLRFKLWSYFFWIQQPKHCFGSKQCSSSCYLPVVYHICICEVSSTCQPGRWALNYAWLYLASLAYINRFKLHKVYSVVQVEMMHCRPHRTGGRTQDKSKLRCYRSYCNHVWR